MALKMKRIDLLIAFLVIFTANLVFAQENLSEPLQALKPFIGKTWKSTFTNSPDGKITYDISRWERALNGKAVRILHSVNDGAYGGETIIYWDKEKERVVYYYFTTEGFMTHGTMHFEGKKVISHEYVKGNEDGVTEVKAVGEILPDGTMKNTTQFLKNGKWIDRPAAIYKEDPDAKVIFK